MTKIYCPEVDCEGMPGCSCVKQEYQKSSRSSAGYIAEIERDAKRYRWLRERNLETIRKGGVFAGITPDNVVLNGVDLDDAIDKAM